MLIQLLQKTRISKIHADFLSTVEDALFGAAGRIQWSIGRKNVCGQHWDGAVCWCKGGGYPRLQKLPLKPRQRKLCNVIAPKLGGESSQSHLII